MIDCGLILSTWWPRVHRQFEFCPLLRNRAGS